MRGFVAPTDDGWYRFFLARRPVDEVNFWQPGGTHFRALQPGEPFFFKLKSPHDAIGGFGLFARFARLPIWRVWEVFGEANGVPSERALRERLARLSANPYVLTDNDRMIGCVSISAPVFFAPDEWVAVPPDWKRNIVRGRGYDLTREPGAALWRECLERAQGHAVDWVDENLDRARHGRPQIVLPRLGQGAFRIAVLQAYDGACAVTSEHSMPVVEAAHIRPWGLGGSHDVSNGIPLRRDLHRLFDLGYMTVRPDHRVAVSGALREEWENGRAYYPLDGGYINLPADARQHPRAQFLDWHSTEVFRG